MGKTIGIIGAMPSELADIRKELGTENTEIQHISGYDFHVHPYKGGTLVTVCCGVGKVNASMCALALKQNYKPDAIINTGVAGGMNPNVKVGDIVIGTDVTQHDLDAQWLNNYPPYKAVYDSDKLLAQMMEKSCEKQNIRCFKGRIISGDSFITDNAVKEQLAKSFSPYAVDMESAAIGQACFMNDVPFVSVRCISDNADDNGTMSFEEFEKIAARKVADVVLTMTKELI